MGENDLRRLPAFREVTSPAARILVERGMERAYASGSVIWTEGAPAERLVVLLAGSVRAVRYRKGREIVLHRAHAGATLGDVPFYDGGAYPASLVAETPVRVLVLDRETLAAAIRLDPGFALMLLQALAHRFRDMAGRLEAQASDPVLCRLARYLQHRSTLSSGAAFTLGMTQGQLAHDLGSVREVVARRLGELVNQGVLERVGRAYYKVASPERLRALAEGAAA